MDSSPSHSTISNKTSNFRKNVDNFNTAKTNITNNLLNYNDNCLQKILQFGRELFQINSQFTTEYGENLANTKMLRVRFFSNYYVGAK